MLGIGFYSGYFFYNPIVKSPDENKTQLNYTIPLELNSVEVTSSDINKIYPDTKIVYEYYYSDQNKSKYFESIPSNDIIGMTKEELELHLSDWQILSFSNKQINLKKVLKVETNNNYIVSEKDGYIAIYSNDNDTKGSLIDITNKVVKSLPIVEQDKIKSGIKLYGNDQLSRFLEDYET